MKIEQLIQVIEIANTQSITLAARNMFMSQSNLSTSIRELEKEMNRQIFIRSNNGTKLTPFGEAFLTQAKSAVNQFEYIKNMSSKQDKWSVKFSISSYYFLFSAYIFLELFQQNKNKNIAFDLKDCSRSSVINSVSAKESELGILSIPTSGKDAWIELINSKDLEYHKITEEQAHILIGQSSPFYHKNLTSVYMKDLVTLPFIDFSEPNKELSQSTNQYLNILEPHTIAHVSDRGSLIRFLQTTDCYHIATKNTKAYQEYLFHESIKAIPIEDCSFNLEISWIKAKNSYLSELGKQFLIKAQELLVLDV